MVLHHGEFLPIQLNASDWKSYVWRQVELLLTNGEKGITFSFSFKYLRCTESDNSFQGKIASQNASQICMRNTHTLFNWRKFSKESRFWFSIYCLFTPTGNKNPWENSRRLNPDFYAPSCAFFHLLLETTSKEDREYMHRLSRSLYTDKKIETIRLTGSNLPVSIFPLKDNFFQHNYSFPVKTFRLVRRKLLILNCTWTETSEEL